MAINLTVTFANLGQFFTSLQESARLSSNERRGRLSPESEVLRAQRPSLDEVLDFPTYAVVAHGANR